MHQSTFLTTLLPLLASGAALPAVPADAASPTAAFQPITVALGGHLFTLPLPPTPVPLWASAFGNRDEKSSSSSSSSSSTAPAAPAITPRPSGRPFTLHQTAPITAGPWPGQAEDLANQDKPAQKAAGSDDDDDDDDENDLKKRHGPGEDDDDEPTTSTSSTTTTFNVPKNPTPVLGGFKQGDLGTLPGDVKPAHSSKSKHAHATPKWPAGASAIPKPKPSHHSHPLIPAAGAKGVAPPHASGRPHSHPLIPADAPANGTTTTSAATPTVSHKAPYFPVGWGPGPVILPATLTKVARK